MNGKEIEKRMKKKYEHLVGYNRYPNWDTWETILILQSYDDLYKLMVNTAKMFNKRVNNETFDMEKAKYFVKKYLIPKARKKDPTINPKNVDLEFIVLQILTLDEAKQKTDKKNKSVKRTRKYKKKR
jgi:hypothetical protein